MNPALLRVPSGWESAELSIDVFAEDGGLAYRGKHDSVTPFRDYGIKCLKEIIADDRLAYVPQQTYRPQAAGCADSTEAG